jgi:hypothetical protein
MGFQNYHYLDSIWYTKATLLPKFENPCSFTDRATMAHPPSYTQFENLWCVSGEASQKSQLGHSL